MALGCKGCPSGAHATRNVARDNTFEGAPPRTFGQRRGASRAARHRQNDTSACLHLGRGGHYPQPAKPRAATGGRRRGNRSSDEFALCRSVCAVDNNSSGSDVPGDAAIRLVCATRQPTAADFHNKTALGRSLASWYPNLPSVALQLFPANQEGLPFVYNKAIDRITTPDEILVFLHDDLHLVDLFWANKLRQAVEHFNIIGLAGNRRRAKRQPSWVFVDERLTWDKSENSAAVSVTATVSLPPSAITDRLRKNACCWTACCWRCDAIFCIGTV